MSHLGIRIAPEGGGVKTKFKSIFLKQSPSKTPDSYIIPFEEGVETVTVLSVLENSVYIGSINKPKPYNLYYDSRIKAKDDVNSSSKVPSSDNAGKNIANGEPKESFFSKLYKFLSDIFLSEESELDDMIKERKRKSTPKKDKMIRYNFPSEKDVLFLDTYSNEDHEFSITYHFLGGDDMDVTALFNSSGELEVQSICPKEYSTFELRFAEKRKNIENSNVVKIHIVNNSKVGKYCLDFGSDSLQIHSGSHPKGRLNIMQSFRDSVKSEFLEQGNKEEQQKIEKWLDEQEILKKDNILQYHQNNDVKLYSNLVFLKNGQIHSIDNLPNEVTKKPSSNDIVQYFTSSVFYGGVQSYKLKNHNGSISAGNVQGYKDKLNELYESIEVETGSGENAQNDLNKKQISNNSIFSEDFRSYVEEVFLKVDRSLQKNLKLSFLDENNDEELENIYKHVYDTCIANLIWIISKKMKDNNSSFLDLIMLYPNVFDGQEVIRLKSRMISVLQSLCDNDQCFLSNGYELQLLSESDAAFLGIWKDIKTHQKESVKENEYVLLIDVGKGTSDVSLIRKEMKDRSSVFYSIAQNGNVMAGNYFSLHILLDLLCVGLQDQSERSVYMKQYITDMCLYPAQCFNILKNTEILKKRIGQSNTNFNTSMNDGLSADPKLQELDRYLAQLVQGNYQPSNTGTYYTSCIKRMANDMQKIIESMLRTYGLSSTDVSMVVLSGRTFKNSDVQSIFESMLEDYGFVKPMIKAEKQYAVDVWQNRNKINFNGSALDVPVSFLNGGDMEIVPFPKLITGGIELNGKNLKRQGRSYSGVSQDEKIYFIDNKYLSSKLNEADKLNRMQNSPSPKDLRMSGFPFNGDVAQDIDFLLCNKIDAQKKESATPPDSVILDPPNIKEDYRDFKARKEDAQRSQSEPKKARQDNFNESTQTDTNDANDTANNDGNDVDKDWLDEYVNTPD